jgi:hypothetical protein
MFEIAGFVGSVPKEGLFSLEKLQGHEADLSSPSTVEIKKIWIYTSTLYFFIAYVVKHRYMASSKRLLR